MKLSDTDRWIIEYLRRHEQASESLIRTLHNEHRSSDVSRQYINRRLNELEEHNYIVRVHEDVSEYRLAGHRRNEESEAEKAFEALTVLREMEPERFPNMRLRKLWDDVVDRLDDLAVELAE